MKYYPVWVGKKLHSFVTLHERGGPPNDCVMHYDKRFPLWLAMWNDDVDSYMEEAWGGKLEN